MSDVYRHDFKGQALCDACWNGNHYIYKRSHTGKPTNIKLANCQQVTADGEPCGCQCRAMLAEREERRNRARVVEQ